MRKLDLKPFGARIAELAQEMSAEISDRVDMKNLGDNRTYILELQEGFLTPLVVEYAKKFDKEDFVNQIYFQITPDATPQLSIDEFCAGVCIENVGKWKIREHNLTHIKDIIEENKFFKWWYFECIRMNVSGWTRVYYDPYLKKDVITHSTPVYSHCGSFIGVLGIDVDYNDFMAAINRRLVENIKNDIETLKQEHACIGEEGTMEHQYLDVNTYELINNVSITHSTGNHSPKMREVMEIVKRATISDANVLLQGETGVGKDFIANSIHRNSSFAGGPFINVNCCALSENLIESELFGYGAGAFTGAKNAGKAGYFEAANNGTIVLNEIGDLPLHLQAKLLSVIQDKEVMRIGETLRRKSNFRLIVATNKDLPQMVSERSFREDLYYRLNVIPIAIPPLRERKEDLYPLINLFLEQNIKKYRIDKKLSVELINMLTEYSWPGNIRELENLVERLVITAKGKNLTKLDLPKDFIKRFEETKIKEFTFEFSEKATDPLAVPDLKKLRENLERELFREMYIKLGSSYKVAKALGISQTQAYKKIKKYALNMI